MKYENIKMEGDADKVRYFLKKEGQHPMVVIGVNPSKATDKVPDATMARVMRLAELNGFDSFIMLNLYPQRSTKPTGLDKERDEVLHLENLKQIEAAVAGLDNPVVLCAFGNTIGVRRYLKDCLKDIVRVFEPKHPQWKQIGKPTVWGNPRHPSRAAYGELADFDMAAYLA